MKTLALLIGITTTGSVYAAIADNNSTAKATESKSQQIVLLECTVDEVVDESFLEESLSKDEYPDVSIIKDTVFDSLSVYLGASLYSEDDGDIIEQKSTVGFDKNFLIQVVGQFEEFSIITNGTVKDQNGQLFGRVRDDEKTPFGDWVLIANMTCQ